MESSLKLKNIIKYVYYRQELQYVLQKEHDCVTQGIMLAFAVDADGR